MKLTKYLQGSSALSISLFTNSLSGYNKISQLSRLVSMNSLGKFLSISFSKNILLFGATLTAVGGSGVVYGGGETTINIAFPANTNDTIVGPNSTTDYKIIADGVTGIVTRINGLDGVSANKTTIIIKNLADITTTNKFKDFNSGDVISIESGAKLAHTSGAGNIAINADAPNMTITLKGNGTTLIGDLDLFNDDQIVTFGSDNPTDTVSMNGDITTDSKNLKLSLKSKTIITGDVLISLGSKEGGMEITFSDEAKITGNLSLITSEMSNTFNFNSSEVMIAPGNNVTGGKAGDKFNIYAGVVEEILPNRTTADVAGDSKDIFNFTGGKLIKKLILKEKAEVNISGNFILGDGLATDTILDAGGTTVLTRYDVKGNSVIQGKVILGPFGNIFYLSENATLKGDLELGAGGDLLEISGGNIDGEVIGNVGSNVKITGTFTSINKIKDIDTFETTKTAPGSTVKFTAGADMENIKDIVVGSGTEFAINTANITATTTFNNLGKVSVTGGERTITGPYSQDQNAILAFTVLNGATTGNLKVTGDTKLNDGKIEVDIPSTEVSNISNGSTLKIINTTGANPITGTNVSLIKPDGSNLNTVVFTFTPKLSVDEKTLEISVQKQALSSVLDGDAGISSGLITEFNNIKDSAGTSSALKTALSNIENATPEQAKKGLQELLTNTNNAIVEGVTNITGRVQTNIANRLDTVRTAMSNQLNNIVGGGYSAGDDQQDAKPKYLWGEIFGNKATQKERDDVSGYKLNSRGFTFGVDNQIRDDITVGASLTYANTTTKNTDVTNSKLKIKSYQASLYSMYDQPNYFLEGIFSYGVHRYENNRNIVTLNTGTAKSNFKGQEYTLKAKIGKMMMRDDYMLTPFAYINYSLLKTEKYDESGDLSLNLRNIKSKDYNSIKLGIGTRFSYYDITENDSFIPSITVMLERDLTSNRQKSSANFAGSAVSFNIESAKPAKNSLHLGGDVKLYTKNNLQIIANYNYEVRSKYNSHYGAIKVLYAL